MTNRPLPRNSSKTVPIHRDRYAVIGHPVEHSKSPIIHAAFAEATGQALRYDHLNAPLDSFAATVRGFIAGGGKGLNVTVPFKLEAFEIADVLSERARAAGAVNTLLFEEQDGVSRIYGDNTDGAGLVRDIEENLHRSISGCRVLLLGAGGAARGTILPLLARRPVQLTIVNRTLGRAAELVSRFESDANRLGCRLTAGQFESTENQPPYDIVINATSGSLAGDVPAFADSAIASGTLAYDMMYGPTPTVFMRHAAALGADAYDGLGMLVEQAAESFALWRHVRPAGAPVLALLRKSMGLVQQGSHNGAQGRPHASRNAKSVSKPL